MLEIIADIGADKGSACRGFILIERHVNIPFPNYYLLRFDGPFGAVFYTLAANNADRLIEDAVLDRAERADQCA